MDVTVPAEKLAPSTSVGTIPLMFFLKKFEADGPSLFSLPLPSPSFVCGYWHILAKRVESC